MRRQRWIGAADRAVMTRVARTENVVLDRVLPRLGRSANYGRLWAGVAGVLAATQQPKARRAAVRGLVALSLASAAVNVISKQLVGRPRPAADLAPLIRRLAIAPRTTSFPSGHSASAAAFATGVLLESPLLGVPVAVTAAGVATSRVAVGAHYPSDVVAGVGVGVIAGLATQTWWPRGPLDPATAAAPDHRPPALSTGAGLVLVTNAGAGSVRDDSLRRIAAELPEAEVIVAGPEHDLAAVIEDAAKRCVVLGVAGGDGTVNLGAKTAVRHDVPLLVVPAGTLNHFARDSGVESIEAAIGALRAGEAVRVDLGRAGDEVFVNTSSIGLYVDLVRFRERWEKRLGKWPAMLVGLVHVLRHSEPEEVEVEGVPRRLWMLFAGNCAHEPVGFAPTSRPSLDDGLLDVRIVDAAVPLARTRIVLGALTRTLRWSRAYELSRRTSLQLKGMNGTLALSVDGEVTDVPQTVELGKSPRALTVYRPGGAASGTGRHSG